ncbi:glycosyltransferase family 4 protein [Azospirillum sp.]|uniref:glycosyltransferase family 4 protein n=1 Tax=Azospirillum sp. TaxID=34012 RepID=UPI003D72374B
MKIAIIGSRGMHASYGGIERVLCELCPRLAALGHEVHVFSEAGCPLPDKPAPGVHIVKVRGLPGKYTETLSRSALSLAIALTQRFDVINLVAIGPGALSFIPRLAGKPTVVSVHGLDWRRDKWPWIARVLLRSAERMIVLAADEITVVSRQLETHFAQAHGRAVVHIPNGLNRRDVHPDQECLDDFGLEAGRYVLFASRLVAEKGAHELIEAFNGVDTDMKLVIAGGTRYDQRYAARLRALDTTGRCIFTGHVTGRSLDALFAGAYFYALPSHLEGLSLSLLEAVGFGKATLVSDIPENIEVVGEHGLTFPVGRVDLLRDRLQQLIDHPQLVEDIAARVRTAVPRHYAWDTLARRYAQTFEDLVARRQPGGRPQSATR